MPAEGDPVPLSAGQRAVWTQCRQAGAEFAVRGAAFAVPAPGAASAAARHLAAAVDRHPVLRHRLAEDQHHWLPGRPPLLITEHAPGRAGSNRAHAWRRRLLARPIDPWRGPLVRVSLALYPDGVTEMLIVAHAAALDAASLRALAAMLRGEPSVESAELGEPEAPWTSVEPPPWGGRTAPGIDAAPHTIDLPVPLHLPDPAALVRAVGLVLGRWTGSRAATVAVATTGRPIGVAAPELLKVTVREDWPLAEASIRPDAASGVRSHVVLLPAVDDLLDEVVQVNLAPVELRLARGTLYCSYRPDLVTAAAAQGVAAAIAAAVRSLERAPRRAAGAVDIAASPGSSLPGPVIPADATIHGAVARRAATTPDRVAVTCGDSRLTYGELVAGATLVAGAVRDAGVVPGDRVGVLMSRSADLVTALLGVLMSGSAYVPLDPDYPPARLQFMAEDAGLACVIADRVAPVDFGVPVLAPPTATGPDRPIVSTLDAGIDADAYVIYTSGSTGRPKGVVVSHGNLLALLAATEGYEFSPDDVWTLFHSYAFDFSVWEMWGCLTSGGRLVVVPSRVARDAVEFRRLLRAERVTVLNQTPSAFAQLLTAESEQPPGLRVRLLVFGGERLDARLLLPWFDRYDEERCRVVNMYGITETTVHCTWRTLTRSDALRASDSVGTPLPGWSVHILDAAGREMPAGVPGEICIGGAGVSAGYLHRPGLTARRFVPTMRTPHPGTRLYRSGDLGRLRPDGELEHLGRIDEQVKVRGHRVELGEIRARLLAATGVTAAAVVPRRHDEQVFLDAYVTGRVDTVELRRELATVLPEYLMPATIIVVAQLPTTVNGKLDTSRLPAPGSRAVVASPPAPADTPPAPLTTVIQVWEQTLGVPVTADDNLFLIGGNSLTVQRIVLGLRDAGFGEAAVRVVYRNPTPRLLTARLLAEEVTT
ncbi:non-ribosomal peptide synthetase [Salinispora arenicola]|uniref:non-ribosomal peptide synthetase n=1 Tax=Salinispora arenicola TaxID=168697 RepID=UPI0003668006|nr:non-ribosomal peptide synthetase [Salinispora arenicola]